MKKFQLAIFSCILITTIESANAGDAFCYRDESNILSCQKSLELIPPEYRAKAFYKEVVEVKPILRPTPTWTPTPLPAPTQSTIDFSKNLPSRLPPANNYDQNIQPSNNLNQASDLPTAAQTSIATPIQLALPTATPTLVATATPTPLEIKARVEEKIPAPDNFLPPAKSLPTKSSNNEIPQSNNSSSQKSTNSAQKSNPKIQIFVAKWCPHCKALEEFLKSEKIAYAKYDVEEDSYGMEVFNKEGGGIPISKIGDTTIVGFDEAKFRALLEAQRPY